MSTPPPWQDLVVGRIGPNALFRNDGTGNFTAVTGTPITLGWVFTRAVAWGDMDGDGDLVRRWLFRTQKLPVRTRGTHRSFELRDAFA